MTPENTTTIERLPLTPSQQRAYEFIASTAGLWGPSVREIAAGLSYKSPHAVTGMLEQLERKGWITREPGQARGIRVKA
jgi:DNA-binding MarR family transcriptional regulator